MHLELRSRRSSDFVRAAQVERNAYSGNHFSKILFPGPFPDNLMELRAQEIEKEIEVEPANRWFQIVDTDAEDPNEAIAVAKWQIYTDKVAGPRQNRRFGKGCNVGACERLFGDLAAFREKYIVDKHCLCMYSFPHPDKSLDHPLISNSSSTNSCHRPDTHAARRRRYAPQMGDRQG